MEMKRVFAGVASQKGYVEVRPKQEEVILHFVSGNDILMNPLELESLCAILCYLSPTKYADCRVYHSLS